MPSKQPHILTWLLCTLPQPPLSHCWLWLQQVWEEGGQWCGCMGTRFGVCGFGCKVCTYICWCVFQENSRQKIWIGIEGRRRGLRNREKTAAIHHRLRQEQWSGLSSLWMRSRTGRYVSTSTLMAALAMISCRKFLLLLCMMSIVICSWHCMPTSPGGYRRTHRSQLLCKFAAWIEQQSQWHWHRPWQGRSVGAGRWRSVRVSRWVLSTTLLLLLIFYATATAATEWKATIWLLGLL